MTVVPFPRARHRPFVLKHARNITTLNQAAGEKYLAQQLELQEAAMRRRGIPEERVKTERQRLESAIRVTLSHLIMRQPEGAA
jgi:Family of unknown function (DUF6074)